MKADATGITINKAELGCLLFFAGKSDAAVVKFRIDPQQKLVVTASDGKRAVECRAPGTHAERGEWTVPGYWLEKLRRSVDKGRTEVLLKPKSNELKRAAIIGAATHEEQMGADDKTSGTSTQVSMESLHKLTKGELPLTGSWFAIVPKHVNKAFDVLSKAAGGCPVTLYPPKDPSEQVVMACSSDAGTWRGVLQPAAVEGPGGEAEEQDDEDDAPPGRVAKQPSLPGTDEADDDDGDNSGVVSDEYAEKLKTQKAPKKKAAKKAAKKGRKKS